MANEYKEVFNELINDTEFIQLLDKEGPNSLSAQKRASSLFLNRPRPLPFMFIKLFNMDGIGFTEYSNSDKEAVETNIDALEMFILKILWKRNGIKENVNFKKSIIQELFEQMYSASEKENNF